VYLFAAQLTQFVVNRKFTNSFRLKKNSTVLQSHLSAVAIAGILAGCATVKGAGKDIQSVGQAGQDAID